MKGRPPGTTTAAKIRKLLASHQDALVKTVVDMALDGDVQALRLCLERICPALKATNEPVAIPALAEATSLVDQGATVITAMAEGSLSSADGAALIAALSHHTKIIEFDELTRRIEQLEQRYEHQNPA